MKILEAQIKGGKVFVEDVEVSNVTVLCEGKSDSVGYFLIDADRYFYITKTTQDLTKTLDLIVEALQKITVNSLGTPTQGWAAPPTLPTELIEVINKINQLKQRQI